MYFWGLVLLLFAGRLARLVGAHVVVVVGATSVRDGNLLVLVGRIELAVVLVAPLVLVVG